MESKTYKGKNRSGNDVWVNEKGDNVCGIDGCFSTHRVAKGLCNKHYLIQVKNTQKHECEITGYQCGGRVNLYKATGQYLCAKHRNHIVKHGKIQSDIEPMPEKCTVEGCSEIYLASGYCSKHYKEFQYHGKIRSEEEKDRTRYCCICNSSEKTVKMDDEKIYCGKHYSQMRQNGEILEWTRYDPNNFIIENEYIRVQVYNAGQNEIHEVTIDKDMYDFIKEHKITLTNDGHAQITMNKERVRLGRYILNIIDDEDLYVGYKNNNRLDNRRENLRAITREQLSMGSSVQKNSTSGIRGVEWYSVVERWVPSIVYQKRKIYLGSYTNKNDAIRSREMAELHYFGEYSSKYHELIVKYESQLDEIFNCDDIKEIIGRPQNDKSKYKKRKVIHGMVYTPIYNSWNSMKTRCLIESHDNYHHYGGRGIKICDDWMSFVNFYKDMKDTWFIGSTIDRIDVNGNYEPSNCRWATKKEQTRNRRNTFKVSVEGEDIALAELLDAIGRENDYGYIISRLQKGWSIDDALNTPKNYKYNAKDKLKEGLKQEFGNVEYGYKLKKKDFWNKYDFSSTTYKRYIDNEDIIQILNDLNIHTNRDYLYKGEI